MLNHIKPVVRRTPVVGPLCRRAALWYRSLRRRGFSAQDAFTDIFHRNAWKGTDSVSGQGSDLIQTSRIIGLLPGLLHDLRVDSLLDIPCGDFFWMRQVDLSGVGYIGGDIVAELIRQNKQYETPRISFETMDLLTSPLPKVDLVFCRDCLVHLSYGDISRALDNIGRSGSELLLTTTFPRHLRNQDIPTGEWRTLNLESKPFGFPKPLRMLEEGCTQAPEYADKSLGLWRMADVKKCLIENGLQSAVREASRRTGEGSRTVLQKEESLYHAREG